MKAKEEHFFSGERSHPAIKSEFRRMEKLLKEIRETLIQRADGISIAVVRDSAFPPHKGKALITEVNIKTHAYG